MEKEQVIKELQKNAETIVKNLLPTALNKGEDSKYKNLINGLSSTLDLIDKYSWQLKWSKFRDETGKQFVSIWEQNIDGEIRNNEKFAVGESITLTGKTLTITNNNGSLEINTDGTIINNYGFSVATQDKNILKCRVYNTNKIFDKYIKTSQKMLDLFNEVEDNRESQVIYTDENMRNIGKTYSLYNILKDNESAILLTKNSKLFKEQYKDIKSDRIFSRVDDIRGIDKSKIILVDEFISKEEFNKMIELSIIYCGYRNISTL